jgi:hypothetical protein
MTPYPPIASQAEQLQIFSNIETGCRDNPSRSTLCEAPFESSCGLCPPGYCPAQRVLREADMEVCPYGKNSIVINTN